jgi:hypothetical protein
MAKQNYITVWPFDAAPKKYKERSQNGGDEDWVALVPDAIYRANGKYINWIEGGSFGCCTVEVYKIKGAVLFIGCHA